MSHSRPSALLAALRLLMDSFIRLYVREILSSLQSNVKVSVFKAGMILYLLCAHSLLSFAALFS